MTSSKKSTGGVHVEREIVRATARVEVPGIDFRQSYADGYVQPMYVGGPFLLSAFMQALPQWVAVQVQASLDARGMSPVLLDAAAAQEVFSLIRTALLTDLASAQDSIALGQMVAWLDAAGAVEAFSVGSAASVLSSATALESVVFGYPQVDTGVSIDSLTATVQVELRDAAAAVDPLALRLSRSFLDSSAAADDVSLHKQTYATGYVESPYVGELITF